MERIVEKVGRRMKYALIIGAVITTLGGLAMVGGIACNKAVVKANGGQMPVIPEPGYEKFFKEALEQTKQHSEAQEYKLADENTQLKILADRYHVIENGVLVSSHSLGDTLIWVGNLVFDFGFFVMAGILVIMVLTGKAPWAKKVGK